MLITPLVRHFCTAGNEHDLHSPFLFEFYNKIIKSNNLPAGVPQLESLRKKLKKNNSVIEITDFGAGSRWNNSNIRKISTIARTSEKAQKWQAILFRIVQSYCENGVILELGTSLGLTTAHLAWSNSQNQVFTFEGCPQIAGVAKLNFQELRLKNISQIIGNIDKTLPEFLKQHQKIDIVFFDANHRYEPTMRYFELCLTKCHVESIFIFDDIYWSDEMRRAWEEIKKYDAVQQTLDFWQIGIVLFRKSQVEQHFRLKA